MSTEAKKLTDAELESHFGSIDGHANPFDVQAVRAHIDALSVENAAQQAELAAIRGEKENCVRLIDDAEVERLAEGSREIRLAGILPMTWEDAGEDIREGYRRSVRYLATELRAVESAEVAELRAKLAGMIDPRAIYDTFECPSCGGSKEVSTFGLDGESDKKPCEFCEQAGFVSLAQLMEWFGELRAKLEAAERREPTTCVDRDFAWCPDKCPITQLPFFMWIERDGKWLPTYGGPYDSYTIPEMEGEPDEQWHERELSRERYDHDLGGWRECESISLRVVLEDVLFGLEAQRDQLHQRAEAAERQSSKLTEKARELADRLGLEIEAGYLHDALTDAIAAIDDRAAHKKRADNAERERDEAIRDRANFERSLTELADEFRAPTKWAPRDTTVTLFPMGRIRVHLGNQKADRDRLAAELAAAKRELEGKTARLEAFERSPDDKQKIIWQLEEAVTQAESRDNELRAKLEVAERECADAQGDIEHLIACGFIGKATTVIGRSRLKSLCASEKQLAELARPCEELIGTAKQVATRLKAMPFTNDRAHGGMLLCHAENLESALAAAKCDATDNAEHSVDATKTIKPDGSSLIAAERRRQVEQEGWDAGHDDEHDLEELARAAACYAVGKPLFCFDNGSHWDIWPFAPEWDRRGKHPRIKQLAIAGALCAAEIDRLLRLQKSEPDHSVDAGKTIDAEPDDAGYLEAIAKSREPIVRLSCARCNEEHDGITPTQLAALVQAGWREIEEVEPSDSVLDWETHVGYCKECAKEWADEEATEPEQPAFVCPKCGGTKFEESGAIIACAHHGCCWYGTIDDVRAAREPAQPTAPGWAWAAWW